MHSATGEEFREERTERDGAGTVSLCVFGAGEVLCTLKQSKPR